MAAKRKKRGKTVGKRVGAPMVGAAAKGLPTTPPKPGKPVRPPAGFYDPQLDALEAATRRGYGDARLDFSRDFGADGHGGRMFNDFTLATEGLRTQRDRALQDLAARRGDVNLGYTRLARTQGEGDRRAGVTSAGLLAQQQAIRGANQQRDLAPIAQAETRVGEDFKTQTGQVGLQYQRAGEDATTGLQRSGRELGQFGIDTQAARLFQATQAGYVPPGAAAKPAAPSKPRGTSKRRRRTSMGRRGGSLVGGTARVVGSNTASGVGAVY